MIFSKGWKVIWCLQNSRDQSPWNLGWLTKRPLIMAMVISMLKTHFFAFWTHFCQKNQTSEFLLKKRRYDCWHGQQTIFFEKFGLNIKENHTWTLKRIWTHYVMLALATRRLANDHFLISSTWNPNKEGCQGSWISPSMTDIIVCYRR